MGGPGFRRALAQVLGRFTRAEQPVLRERKPFIARALFLFEPADGQPGFVLAAIQRFTLLHRLPMFANELLALLGEPHRFVRRPLQLPLVTHDRLFLFVELGVQGRDGA